VHGQRDVFVDALPRRPPPRLAFWHRVALGLLRRGKLRLLPVDEAFRTLPLGIARGLRAEVSLQGPAYRWLGLYEYEIHRHLRRLCPPGARVVDIGGADGVYAMAFARMSGRPCVTFEGDRIAVARIRRHLEANPPAARQVTVVPSFVGAVSDRAANMIALDDVEFDDPPSLLKIDVEGAEADVLRGGRGLLARHRPHVVVETHGRTEEQACGDLLLSYGYRPRVVPRRRRLREDRPTPHNRWLVAVGAPGQLERERAFHDALAADLDPDAMPPQPLEPLDLAAIRRAGDLDGKRVLDLGCGSGDLTLPLVQAGARVTAVDLSAGMLAVARQRCEHFCAALPQPAFVAAAAEDLPFADGAFDAVVGRFILHHLDMARAPAQIARVLAPGGVAVFVENSGANRLLMFARRHLAGHFGIARYGTEDERPLQRQDLYALETAFLRVELSYPVFDFLTIFDRQVLRYRWPAISRACVAGDSWLWRAVPRVRRYSYRVLVTAFA
jgi:ubiquinone/menaquinone biosynthesis C-methylase UbiE